MRSEYAGLSYQELKQLIEDRGIVPDGDMRRKKSLVRALEMADLEEQREAEEAEEAKRREEEPKTPLEQRLEGMVPGMSQRMSFGRDYTVSANPVNEQMKVGNLPAEYVHAWASLSVGEGEDIARWTSNGWIRATEDMVTSDPNDTDRIYVRSYEPYSGYVKHKDCLLVIANRRLVEDRQQGYTERWNEKVERMYGKRGELTRDRVGDPSEGSGRTYRRTAQWKAEEMFEGGS